MVTWKILLELRGTIKPPISINGEGMPRQRRQFLNQNPIDLLVLYDFMYVVPPLTPTPVL